MCRSSTGGYVLQDLAGIVDRPSGHSPRTKPLAPGKDRSRAASLHGRVARLTDRRETLRQKIWSFQRVTLLRDVLYVALTRYVNLGPRLRPVLTACRGRRSFAPFAVRDHDRSGSSAIVSRPRRCRPFGLTPPGLQPPDRSRMVRIRRMTSHRVRGSG